jgi:hypothetical protein
MRTELRDFGRNLLAESRFVELGNFVYVQRLVDERIASKIDHNYRLGLLINLEVWYRMFFKGMSTPAMQQDPPRRSRPNAWCFLSQGLARRRAIRLEAAPALAPRRPAWLLLRCPGLWEHVREASIQPVRAKWQSSILRYAGS